MKHRQSVNNLSKFLLYIIGRQPDELGLVPDEKGYVKIKDLIKALGEEPGWRHVRLNHIREVIYSAGSSPIEMVDNRIRAVDRSRLVLPEIPSNLPTLLYIPIRRRAHPVLLEKGLPSAPSGNRIILSDDLTLAQRLGRRIDPSPVILTVNSEHARKKGATIWRFGNRLFLSDSLPLGCFSGPPLPKSRPEPKRADAPGPQNGPKTPGSYEVDLTPDAIDKELSKKRSRQRKNAWKRERKRKHRNDPFRSDGP